MRIWLASFLAIVGAAVGSFVNVVAIRVPAGRSLGGRSRCAGCSTELHGLDLVPILSWLALRGRCRHCDDPISGSYAVGEAACSVVYFVLGLHFGAHLVLLPFLLLAAGLVALSAVDFRTFRLPDRIVGPLTVLVVGAFLLTAVVDGRGTDLARALEAGAAATATLGLLHLAYPRGMGFGDVKLAFVLGVATGWVSWEAVGLTIFIAASLGAVAGVVGARMAGVAVRGHKLPFGPFLSAGALLAAVAGPATLHWYGNLLR